MTIEISPFKEFLKRFSNTQKKLASLDIDLSTYLAIWVSNDKLNIAELGGENIVHHKDIIRERNTRNMLVSWLEERAITKNLKFVAAEIVGEKWLKPIISDLWLTEDIVPYFIPSTFASDEEIETEYVKNIANRFSGNNIAKVGVTLDNEVEVGEIVTLEDYKKITSKKEFELLLELTKKFKGKKLIFINATPQGGGVAIMRHALIRLYRLLGADVHWYVLVPSKDAFDITKTKFHNVLQAVSDPSIHLTQRDKAIYNAWMEQNAKALKKVYKDADVIVIDDPQPSGLVQYIRKVNPKGKILYRSHIQIESHLANTPNTPQAITWDFIWDNIKDNDLFISHPITKFIPASVPKNSIVMMPATTDALDGLNKPLNPRHTHYYLTLFDQILIASQQEPLDKKRPYIIQVARFDPSKGIPDVIESYRMLIETLRKNNSVLPQLVIVGHGSIDDPDGIPLYNLTMELLRSEKYKHLLRDIKVARLPHVDQILNVLLREAKVALQLSHKEGFEVKVSEALMKGVPVVAYKAGGIPLQIKHGVSGYLVPVGDTKKVAEHLHGLFTNDELYYTMRDGARENVNPETSTASNAIKWLFLALAVTENKEFEGKGKSVQDLINAKHK